LGNRRHPPNDKDRDKHKVERAKQLIKDLVEDDDPDATAFIIELSEHLPDHDAMDQDERWLGIAKQSAIKCFTALGARGIIELADKLFSKIW